MNLILAGGVKDPENFADVTCTWCPGCGPARRGGGGTAEMTKATKTATTTYFSLLQVDGKSA